MNKKPLYFVLSLCIALAACAAVGVARAEAITFAPWAEYPAGTSPSAMAIGDFDHDRVKDLAVTSMDSARVSVLLGEGDGTFASAVEYATPTGSVSNAIAVGELNGDAFDDLVVASLVSDTVSVFIGNGVGTFAARTDYPVAGIPVAVATGDLDGNGYADIAVADAEEERALVLLNAGTGFTASSFATSGPPLSIAVGDVDADGHDDLALGGENFTDVLLGDGFGDFPDRVVTSQSGTAHDIVGGDFDGDGDFDLAEIDRLGGQLWTLLASSGGALTSNAAYAVAAQAHGIDAADLNGDGNGDLVVTTGSPSTYSVLFGNGDGGFVDPVQFPGNDGDDVIGADFDGDGIVDLVSTAPDWSAVRVQLCRWPQPPSGTMTIDGGAAATKSLAALVSSNVTEAFLMRVRNQGGSWGGWMPYSKMAAWALPSGDGTKAVDVQYSNLVGRTTLSSSIVLDTTPPTTTDNAPSGWQKTSTLDVTLIPEDTGSGVASTQYKVDQESMWATGTTVTVTGNGTHTVRYRSTDVAGNVEETEFCAVQLDSTPPVTTASGPLSGWHAFPVTVVFSALDTISDVEQTQWSTDGGASWTSGVSVTAWAQGETTISYRSIDQAGNVETARTCTARVDTQAPSTSGANLTARKNKKAVFKVKITDPKPCSPDGAAVQIRIKNAKGKDVKVLSFANVATNVTVSLTWSKCALAKGNYSYKVYATDAAGNVQKAAGGAKLKVK